MLVFKNYNRYLYYLNIIILYITNNYVICIIKKLNKKNKQKTFRIQV